MTDANLWILGVAALGFAALAVFMTLAHRPVAAMAAALFCVGTLFFLWALREPDITKWIGLAVACLGGAYATWRSLESGR
jgi:Ca2+/Na+ antiporter